MLGADSSQSHLRGAGPFILLRQPAAPCRTSIFFGVRLGLRPLSRESANHCPVSVGGRRDRLMKSLSRVAVLSSHLAAASDAAELDDIAAVRAVMDKYTQVLLLLRSAGP